MLALIFWILFSPEKFVVQLNREPLPPPPFVIEIEEERVERARTPIVYLGSKPRIQPKNEKGVGCLPADISRDIPYRHSPAA